MLHQPASLQPIALACGIGKTDAERQTRWLLTTLLFVVCGFFALPHDFAIARFFKAESLPGGLDDVIKRAETFAHGIGVATILITLFVVDLSRRWALPRVILAVVSAGLAANGIKLLIGRLRPHSADLGAELSDSFTSLLPLLSVGSTERSTPSAHTATAVAFAIGLAWLYPRGRSIFFTLAALAALQRLAGSAHFLSDVLWGVGIGYFIGRGMVAGWLTGRRFNCWETQRYIATSGCKPRTEQPDAGPADRRQAA